MIDKDRFCEYMDNVYTAYSTDDVIYKTMNAIGINFDFSLSFLAGSVLDLLTELLDLDEEDEYILYWWVDDYDFGRAEGADRVEVRFGGAEHCVDLTSPEKLYDFIVARKAAAA